MRDRDRDVAIALVLLWLLWPHEEASGAGQVAYVGYTPEGQPVPLTSPPEPVPMPIPTYYVPIDAREPIDAWGQLFGGWPATVNRELLNI
jgi:hypothetical protein